MESTARLIFAQMLALFQQPGSDQDSGKQEQQSERVFTFAGQNKSTVQKIDFFSKIHRPSKSGQPDSQDSRKQQQSGCVFAFAGQNKCSLQKCCFSPESEQPSEFIEKPKGDFIQCGIESEKFKSDFNNESSTKENCEKSYRENCEISRKCEIAVQRIFERLLYKEYCKEQLKKFEFSLQSRRISEELSKLFYKEYCRKIFVNNRFVDRDGRSICAY